jgi:hypothetical protein
MVQRLTEVLGELQRRRLLDPDADLTEATDVWTVLVNGLISQQLANEPGGSLESGRYTRLIAPLVHAFLLQYGTKPGRKRQPSR